MLRAALTSVANLLVLAAALFVPAGRFDWPMAWALLVFFAIFSVVGFRYLDPGLIAERTHIPAETRRADLLLAVPALLLLLPVTFVVCGLDQRFGWSSALPAPLRLVAFALFCAGYAFSLWAAQANPFFSSVVRIQRERGHHLIDRGPYAWIRHPGYAGSLAGHLFLPLALASFWGFLPTACGAAFLALRTLYEERMLVRELPGYRDYTARVRWRLVPHLW